MLVFLAVFQSHKTVGQMVISAPSKERAFELAKARLEHVGLAVKNLHFSVDRNIVEFNTNEEDCFVFVDDDH